MVLGMTFDTNFDLDDDGDNGTDFGGGEDFGGEGEFAPDTGSFGGGEGEFSPDFVTVSVVVKILNRVPSSMPVRTIIPRFSWMPFVMVMPSMRVDRVEIVINRVEIVIMHSLI